MAPHPLENELVGKKVLVAEDDHDTCEQIRIILNSRGFLTSSAKDGRAALELINKDTFDLILSDIRMPELDGIELFRQCKHLEIPFIFMTGFSEALDLKKAFEMGASDFLAKPFGLDELISAVRAALLAKKTANRNGPREIPEFHMIHIEEVLKDNKAIFDIYLRLSQTSYVRIATKGLPLPPDRIAAYQRRGIKHLHLKREDCFSHLQFNPKTGPSQDQGAHPPHPVERQKFLLQFLDNEVPMLKALSATPHLLTDTILLIQDFMAIAVANNDLFRLLEDLRNNHKTIFGHGVNVAAHGIMLATAMGWNSTRTLFTIFLAGLLHDMGLQTINLALAHKERHEMTEEEVLTYETHPEKAHAQLSTKDYLPPEVAIVASQHHEYRSGKGFPKKLTGNSIHPLSRLISVADVYCELTEHALHPFALTPHDAIQRIPATRFSDLEAAYMRALTNVYNLPTPMYLATATYPAYVS